jgi:hypothetical protein
LFEIRQCKDPLRWSLLLSRLRHRLRSPLTVAPRIHQQR